MQGYAQDGDSKWEEWSTVTREVTGEVASEMMQVVVFFFKQKTAYEIGL